MKLDSIFKTAKNGIEVEFRSARPEEAELLIEYLRRVCGETNFLLSEPEDVNFTIEGETAFINACANSEYKLLLCAYVNGEFVGDASFDPVGGAGRTSHRASLGIAIYKEYWNLGIGGLMIDILLDSARKCGYEIMELEVYSHNTRAIHLYNKLGFVERGRYVNGIKYKDGTYSDIVIMQKEL